MKTETLNKFVVVVLIVTLGIAATAFAMVLRLSHRPDEARVRQLIDERLTQTQQPAPAPGLDEAKVNALIDEHLAAAAPASAGKGISEARVKKLIEERVSKLSAPNASGLSEKEFNARVERGILAFIDKQRRAEQERPNRLAKNAPPPSKDDHVYGNPKAPIALIEYSDFECPFCKRFHDSVKQLVDDSNGQVSWIYRHFPLDAHNPGAFKEAEASECAAQLGGNDAFWRYADAIFTRTHSGGRGFPVANLVPLAQEIGLDKTKFSECLSSGRNASKIRQQLIDGQRAGINGTPGSILFDRATGNVRAIIGAQPLDHLQQAVQALKEAKQGS